MSSGNVVLKYLKFIIIISPALITIFASLLRVGFLNPDISNPSYQLIWIVFSAFVLFKQNLFKRIKSKKLWRQTLVLIIYFGVNIIYSVFNPYSYNSNCFSYPIYKVNNNYGLEGRINIYAPVNNFIFLERVGYEANSNSISFGEISQDTQNKMKACYLPNS